MVGTVTTYLALVRGFRHGMGMLFRLRSISALTVLGWLALGCSARGSSNTDTVTPVDDETIPDVPVPAASGPKLVAVKPIVVVRDRPSPNGKAIGTLRAGAQVSRATEPYSKRNCAGGWYPVRPRGFVCAGDDASIDTTHPVALWFGAGPALDRALPYRYARAKKGETVLYAKVPTHDEQLAAEPKLGEGKNKEKEVRPLGVGANDLPLGETFLPTGVAVLQPSAEGVGPDGYRTTASIFKFTGPPALQASLVVGTSLGALENRLVKAKSGVALVGSFVAGEGLEERRYGITPEGHFIPIDRLGEALGSTWHGVDVSKGSLPLAFAIRNPHAWSLGKGDESERLDEEFESKEAVRLSGRFRTVEGTLFYETAENHGWVRHKDFVMVLPRHKFPDFAEGTQKWIDISLANQTLIAWEGHRPMFATLISSGQDRLGDPASGVAATLQGQFRIRTKLISRTLEDAEVRGEFSVAEAPWVLEFADGFAITGSYWQSTFGDSTNFHNVTMTPIDAHWLWHWTDVALPEGWHGVTVPEDASSPIVYIHK